MTKFFYSVGNGYGDGYGNGSGTISSRTRRKS